MCRAQPAKPFLFDTTTREKVSTGINKAAKSVVRGLVAPNLLEQAAEKLTSVSS
jgi:hypothetical protein